MVGEQPWRPGGDHGRDRCCPTDARARTRAAGRPIGKPRSRPARAGVASVPEKSVHDLGNIRRFKNTPPQRPIIGAQMAPSGVAFLTL